MVEQLQELPFLEVLVHDEHGIVFSGNARAVSSSNAGGTFDILLEHTNFITLIKERLEIITDTGEKKSIPVDGGVLHCYTSKVEVYLGIKDTRVKARPVA